MMKQLFFAATFSFAFLSATAQHTFKYRNGDSKSGSLIAVANGQVTFSSGGINHVARLNELQSIDFGQAEGATYTPGALKANEKELTVGKAKVRYAVENRSMTNTPKVDILTEETGMVVVDIVVDKYGNVISATPGAEGSTTKSSYLLTKAKQAAESAKFNTSPTMPLKTSGTFTVIW
jgi:hypothetical protein